MKMILTKMDFCISCTSLQVTAVFILSSIIYKTIGDFQDSSIIINTSNKTTFEIAKQYCKDSKYKGQPDENVIKKPEVQKKLKNFVDNHRHLHIWIREPTQNTQCRIAIITNSGTTFGQQSCDQGAFAACEKYSDKYITTAQTSSRGSQISRTTFNRTPLTSRTHSNDNGVQLTTAVTMEADSVFNIQMLVIAISSIVLFGLIIVAIYLALKYIQQNKKLQHDGTAFSHTTYNDDAALYNFSLCESEFKYDYVTVQEENEATYRNQTGNAIPNRDENPFKVESHTYGNNPSSSPKFDTIRGVSERKVESHVYGNNPGISPKFSIQIAPKGSDKEPRFRPNLSSTCADIHESKLHHQLSLAVMENMYTNATLD